jgi:riboflavin kinase/FMN adenylyltransferase
VQRWRGQVEIPSDWGRCVLTIGVFDGVHRGHAELINHAVKAGRSRGVPTVLMTFDPHPMEVVFPGSHPAQLTTLTRRAELVEEMGVDVFLVMPFTSDFMKLTPERYIHELLVERLHVVEVVVGENFTFGKKAGGNVAMLRKAGERFGFAVESMSLVSENHVDQDRDGTVTFSSTYIRACVDAGDVVVATGSRASWCAATVAARGWDSPPPTSPRPCIRPFLPTASTPPGSPCWVMAP